MKINLIARVQGGGTGLARYAQELYPRLREIGVDVCMTEPRPADLPDFTEGVFKRVGWDTRTFLTNYPLMAQVPEEGLLHLASQNLGGMLLFRHLEPVVITVHDIIHYLLRRDSYLSSYTHAAHRFFDRVAMVGVKKAGTIIADSQYTKNTLIDHLDIPAERIHVVYLGVNQSRFHPVDVRDDFFENYGINRDTKYILFVGSEEPKKNFNLLLRAFAIIREERKDVELLKVGAAGFVYGRPRSIRLAEELGVGDAVRFLDEVSDEDLPLFYSAAKVFAFPSLYEGFGFPALEAMACGAPVVAANRTSIPEIVGDAAMLADAYDPAAWAKAILDVLDSQGLGQKMSAMGLERAQEFSWGKTAEETVKVYNIASAAIFAGNGSKC
ncbi:MAG: glycosyltransferase family 1 protein [Dehalococcoidia bacterium]|nr:glycosyltransferase family 1 protein [Dehalococcoidia bacterium]